MDPIKTKGPVLETVVSAVHLLEFMAEQEKPLGLSEIARNTGAPKANAYRILQTWLALGYLEQNTAGAYQLGYKVFQLSSTHSSGRRLRELAPQCLEKLMEKTGETSNLSVIAGGELVYMNDVEARKPLRVSSPSGRRGPLHATAAGKVLLAYAAGAFMDAYIARGINRFTAQTICTSKGLRAECVKIREAGYAVNAGEWHESVGGVGAPVWDHTGSVVASLSCALAASELTESRINKLVADIVPIAFELSHQLGYSHEES